LINVWMSASIPPATARCLISCWRHVESILFWWQLLYVPLTLSCLAGCGRERDYVTGEKTPEPFRRRPNKLFAPVIPLFCLATHCCVMLRNCFAYTHLSRTKTPVLVHCFCSSFSSENNVKLATNSSFNIYSYIAHRQKLNITLSLPLMVHITYRLALSTDRSVK
jgi:hypothetical protein